MSAAWSARPGSPYPLGATWDGSAVNFALFSEHATRVELCFFDEHGHDSGRVELFAPEQAHVWHARIEGMGPGQRYGYRVHGPWDPANGHRFNPAKLVLDPYARLIDRTITWDDTLFGYDVNADDLVVDHRDSAPGGLRGVVVDPAFDWGDDQAPGTPMHETVIYEMHVKGFSRRHPGVPQHLRGTYSGLASPAGIEHLRSLGVTAVELMPVHHCVSERHLVENGLSNYWGYNTIGFFAPDTRFASGEAVHEFKAMVKALHAAGLEVLLDVVYNHTAEGNHQGPTLCFRGIDNASYYRLEPENRRYYTDYTGTGNTLNMTHPRVIQLIMDSLRYWVTDMHVDGFRFDLASALARELNDVDRLGAFFDAIHQDPVVSRVKLIAEPWDLGEGGYQVGNFPPQWAEWNDQYRDTVRSFWKGDEGQAGALAHRLTGSSDIYGKGGRRPYASINFVTAHDGFTLRDLVSYNEKHNEANGEFAGGTDHNSSWNCGAEGPTDDPAIEALRLRQQRNFLTTLMVSQGVPMVLSGDEIGHTQQGNNNAYCQDNEITWLDWELGPDQRQLLDFTRCVIALRRHHPVFRRRQFAQGRPLHGNDIKDLTWFRPDGQEMSDDDWSHFVRCLGVRLSGDALDEVDAAGQRMRDATFLVLLNAHDEGMEFALPEHGEGDDWRVVVATKDWCVTGDVAAPGGATWQLEPRSLVVMELVAAGQPGAPRG